MILNLNILCVKSGHANIGTQFRIFCECLSLYCKGHNCVSLVWMFALCVVPANRKRWRPSCPVTSVLYPGRVRPMRLLHQWRLWAALCPHSKACHHSSQAWGIPCMVSMALLLRACQATCLEGCLHMGRVLLWCPLTREALPWAWGHPSCLRLGATEAAKHPPH